MLSKSVDPAVSNAAVPIAFLVLASLCIAGGISGCGAAGESVSKEQYSVYSETEFKRDSEELLRAQEELATLGFEAEMVSPEEEEASDEIVGGTTLEAEQSSRGLRARWNHAHFREIEERTRRQRREKGMTVVDVIVSLKQYQDVLAAYIEKYRVYMTPDGRVTRLTRTEELRAVLDLTRKSVQKLKADYEITDEQIASRMEEIRSSKLTLAK